MNTTIDVAIKRLTTTKINMTKASAEVIKGYKSKTSAERLKQFDNYTKKTENNTFIIVESSNKLKNHEYDEWYKNYISGDSGIWVGSGVEDQYLINIDSSGKEIINNCGSSFGYIIKNNNPILVKLLEMKDKGEEDE